jgi:hypothetical protein
MTHTPDPVDAALGDAGYLDDRQFTEGVLAALPPRRGRPRTAVLLAAGAASGLLGALTLAEPLAEAVRLMGTSGGAGFLLVGAAITLAASTFLQVAR